MTSQKRALEAAKTVAAYCQEQDGCQNCIFRKYSSDHWECEIAAFDLRNVLGNTEAKKKHHGYID